jgi:hypothetical protein
MSVGSCEGGETPLSPSPSRSRRETGVPSARHAIHARLPPGVRPRPHTDDAWAPAGLAFASWAGRPALASRDASREPLSLFERTPPKDFLPPTWETPASATYTLLRPTRPPLSLLPSLYSSQEATANMIIYKVSALLACSLSLCAAQLPRLVPPSSGHHRRLCSALLLQPLQTPHHAQPLFANAPL